MPPGRYLRNQAGRRAPTPAFWVGRPELLITLMVLETVNVWPEQMTIELCQLRGVRRGSSPDRQVEQKVRRAEPARLAHHWCPRPGAAPMQGE